MFKTFKNKSKHGLWLYAKHCQLMTSALCMTKKIHPFSHRDLAVMLYL